MRDFRGDTIYFIVLDRFCDGNPANDHGKDEADFDPTRTDFRKYWGGDLAGVLKRLDYVQKLGANAIWLTPVFDQIDEPIEVGGVKMAPYHGYWTRDFKRLDEHLVDRPEEVRVFARDDTVFDRLVAEMHRRGMRLVLDIVCNHSSPHVAGARSELFDDGVPVCRYDSDAGQWYHHQGGVRNWGDLAEVQSHELCGLADFNEESYAFRSYIKGAMKLWLDKGVDAFRVDTVKHMPIWFWQEFTGDMDVHKPHTFMFGEWFQGGCWDPASIDFANRSGMSILDFSWRNAVVSALACRSPAGFGEVAAVIGRDHLFRDATDLVTFVDNHDLPRFLSISNDPERFRLALLVTMVARGVPCLYYGNEQLLHCDTNGGNDPFNRPMMASFEETALMREVATLAALRRRSPAVQKAGMRTKWIDPDAWVFTRPYLGSSVAVALNRADAPRDLDVANLELDDGRYADVLGGAPLDVSNGCARVSLAPRSIAVYEQTKALPTGKVVVDLQIHGVRTAFGERVAICGDAPELGSWDLARAVAMEWIDEETWGTTVAVDASAGSGVHYKYAVLRREGWQREPGRGHRRRVPADGATVWRDEWHG
ncbi:MAG: alpha-amylase family glycosyl hydrolase [Deltaproteobacteria bacterium]|nr:alpha-amylase family glycosyl hydrolase [Deltaproteobacteria bacterium]